MNRPIRFANNKSDKVPQIFGATHNTQNTMENSIENKTALAALDRGLSRVDASLWTTNRVKALRDEAYAVKTGLDASKSLSLISLAAAGGAALLLGGTGVGLIAGSLSLAAYATTLVVDGIDTGRFAPLPFVRTRLGEKLEMLGSADNRNSREAWEESQKLAGTSALKFEADAELFSNLKGELENEALMLARHGRGVVAMLNCVAPIQRDHAYVILCDQYAQFGDAFTGLTIQRMNDALNGELSGDYNRMTPAELKPYAPPIYGLPSERSGGGNQNKKSRQQALPKAEPIGGAIAPVKITGDDAWVEAANSLPAGAPPAKVNTDNQTVRKTETRQSDLALSIAQNLKSMVGIGAPGSGKNFLVYKATEYLKQLQPGIHIAAINTKGDPSELYYWEYCDKVLNLGMGERPFISPEETTDIQSDIAEFISDFQGVKGPKLLILDEALALMESDANWFKGLMAGFNRMCSMGRSSQLYGWVLSQSPNAGDLGISGGTRNVYRRILLVESSNVGIIAGGSTFFSGKPGAKDLNETGRAFYDSLTDEWGAVPKYSRNSSLPEGTKSIEPKDVGESRTAKLENLWENSGSFDK